MVGSLDFNATINGGSIHANNGNVSAGFSTFNGVSLSGNSSHDFIVGSSTLNNCNNTADLNIGRRHFGRGEFY